MNTPVLTIQDDSCNGPGIQRLVLCGVYFIANVQHDVYISTELNELSEDDKAKILEDGFAEYFRHGVKVVKAAPDQTEER